MDCDAGHIFVVLQIALLEIARKAEEDIAGGVVNLLASLAVSEADVHRHRADLAFAGRGHELLPERVRRTEQAIAVLIGHRAEGQVNVLVQLRERYRIIGIAPIISGFV